MADDVEARLAEVQAFYERHHDLASSPAGQDTLWLLSLVRELQAEVYDARKYNEAEMEAMKEGEVKTAIIPSTAVSEAVACRGVG